MNVLLWIIASTLLVSIISLIGVVTFIIKEKLLERLLLILIALSAGALMGGAFLHLIPEAAEKSANYDVFLFVLIGFVLFFFIEKILHWRHCHKKKCSIHTFAYVNLLGDAVHNFTDGLIIAASFIMNIPLGIATTLAIALHEIPQELSEFGVLVYGGFKKGEALLWNFVCALTAMFGGIIGYFFLKYVEGLTILLLPLAAGGFIYIAASDLIPEIRKEVEFRKSFGTFGVFIIGIAIMFALKFVLPS